MTWNYLKSGAAMIALMAPVSVAAQEGSENNEDNEIIVTGNPLSHPEHESIIPASVLTGEELATRGESSIGELLRREPGISSTFFGAGASRPVIRGQSSARISVLDAGIGSIDASSVSDDHAVAVEPATAERVEIVRGAATLYYGSSAAGGVVNVFDGRIPDSVPENGVSGAIRGSVASVDESSEAAGGADIHLGKIGNADVVIHGAGWYRNTSNYEIPGFAESAILREIEEAEAAAMGPADPDDDHDDEEEAFGILDNSDLESKGGSFGGSLIFDNGFIGVAGKLTRSNYGVPGGHHHEEDDDHDDDDHDDDDDHEEEEEEEVRIDLKQDRIDLMGEYNGGFLFFDTAKFRFGYADYIHQEFEGDEIGTTFANEGFEGRIELIEKPHGNFRGASGFQFKKRDFSAIGDEAFTPPNVTKQFGVFTVREYEQGMWHVQVAGRFEHTDVESESIGLSRDFNTFSVSGGVGVEPHENLFLGVNLLRTERAPSAEELFSDGPHLATDAFEIGDPNLDTEVALGVDATVHADIGRLSVTVNGFYTDYDNFIALIPNGLEMDDLPVFEFVARDAVFKGFEGIATADLFSFSGFDVSGRAQVDFVRATFNNAGDAPRIPPLRSIFGLEARSSHFDLRGEIEIAAKQENIAAFELPTDGYQLVNLSAVWRPGGAGHGMSVQVRADNLTNEEARLHTSFLKDVAPLPGRNIKLVVRGEF